MHSRQYLSDRREIQDLLHAYSSAIDRRQFDDLDTVFTIDAHVDYTAFGGPAGPYPEIKKFLIKSLSVERYVAYQHIVANAEITLNGDDGSGRVLCLNPMALPSVPGEREPRVGFYGLWYLDRYRRTPSGWRITHRSEERCFSHNFPPKTQHRENADAYVSIAGAVQPD